MPHQLSYPALRSVLEFLNYRPRIILTIRSRALQRFDNSLPLRIHNMTFYNNLVSIEGQSLAIHISKFTKRYLEGRPHIHVHMVTFYQINSAEKIPLKLNLIVNELSLDFCDLKHVAPFIKSPPTDLIVVPSTVNHATVNHELVHSAKNVRFEIYYGKETISLLPDIEKLPNKRISMKYTDGLHVGDTVRMMRHWIEHGKEIGTICTLSYSNQDNFHGMLRALYQQFNEFQNNWTGAMERFSSSHTIPIEGDAKIQIYKLKKTLGRRIQFLIVLKVVAMSDEGKLDVKLL
ncbi:hypothetical protein CRE_17985 [Caenorhabditis remanei]|uniref:F-box domain-containing protein n=1 Tax=Caenorhabditis remanei TaxID=31234 RepID=E3MDB7_CAERE|nr:hypothetical protein CRE_17985 [Caenorhabditis remanei]